MKSTPLVGHCLTAAAEEESPTVGSGLKEGKGWRRKRPQSNGFRVMAAPKGRHVKASQDGLGLAHQRAERDM